MKVRAILQPRLRSTLRSVGYALVFSAAALMCVGCWNAPGKPRLDADEKRPDEVTDFATLYGKNCAGCHGDHGKYGAAISLANPVYLATASIGDLHHSISMGVAGMLMPGFSKGSGGMLTDRQVDLIAQGMMDAWAKPAMLNGQKPPPYSSHLKADAQHGQQAFGMYCARCHGVDGTGATNGSIRNGSLVDPAYLALISDQGLRSIVIAGKPEQGMPDWRGTSAQAHALSDQEITDIVGWLSAHRTDAPGQPYRQ